MDYKTIYVSQFENCKSTIPSGSINIWKWLLIEPDCIQIINQIRSTSDKDVVRQLKGKLPCVTMSGTFSQRKSDGLISHAGLICIDIDGKDNPHIDNMDDLKLRISKLPYVLYVGLSVSGKGVFCLIPIAYPEKHLEHYFALEAEFQSLGINVDISCKDITRLRYRSLDTKPVINLNATAYEECVKTPSIIQNVPRHSAKHTNTHEVQPIRTEEKELSIEEQFLQPHIDNNIVITARVKTTKGKISDFVEYFVARKMDITEIRDDWFAICCIIRKVFGDDGRVLFHEISQFYPDYTQEECNQLYDSCFSKQKYNYNIGKLSDIASKYGILYAIS